MPQCTCISKNWNKRTHEGMSARPRRTLSHILGDLLQNLFLGDEGEAGPVVSQGDFVVIGVHMRIETVTRKQTCFVQ